MTKKRERGPHRAAKAPEAPQIAEQAEQAPQEAPAAIPEGMVEHKIIKIIVTIKNPKQTPVKLLTGATIPSGGSVDVDIQCLRDNEPWINGQGLDITERLVESVHFKPAPPPEEEE